MIWHMYGIIIMVIYIAHIHSGGRSRSMKLSLGRNFFALFPVGFLLLIYLNVVVHKKPDFS